MTLCSINSTRHVHIYELETIQDGKNQLRQNKVFSDICIVCGRMSKLCFAIFSRSEQIFSISYTKASIWHKSWDTGDSLSSSISLVLWILINIKMFLLVHDLFAISSIQMFFIVRFIKLVEIVNCWDNHHSLSVEDTQYIGILFPKHGWHELPMNRTCDLRGQYKYCFICISIFELAFLWVF